MWDKIEKSSSDKISTYLSGSIVSYAFLLFKGTEISFFSSLLFSVYFKNTFGALIDPSL